MSASLRSRKRTRVTATPVRSSRCSRSAIPPITSCQRPDSSRSQRSASARSAGLPCARPSQTTMLSAARTRSPGTARSFKSAFSTTSSRGSPSVSSSTSGASTRKSTPSCSRIARRRGELEARMSWLAELREEQRGLAGGRLLRVRAVDQIRLDFEAVVAADRARRGLERVGGTDHLARGHDGLVALQHERDERAAGDELHKVAEEGPLAVLGVVLFGQVALDGHVLQSHDPEPLALEAGDDLAREAALERVRLHQDERAVHQPAYWGRSRPARAGRSTAAVSEVAPGRGEGRWAACRGGTAPAAAPARRGRRRVPSAAWPTSASQKGQIFQRGSSGFPQTVQGSLRRRRQLGQRRKLFSISKPQYWQCWCSRPASLAWAAAISSSRSRTSSRYSGGRTIRYTIVPIKGNSEAAVAQATSIGSAIRRWASL